VRVSRLCLCGALCRAEGAAQGHVTGLLGSPSATAATIDGKQVRPQPLGFGGVINDRSFTITAEVDVPEGSGDGMIVTGADDECDMFRDHDERCDLPSAREIVL
jgi:hypothetical protein